MAVFFTVDRRGGCKPGAVLERRPFEIGVAEFQARALELFPSGTTTHGWEWFTSCSRNIFYVDEYGVTRWEPSTELIFELVRRAEHPERPSRFESIFASETIDDAERFRNQFSSQAASIWAVEADEWFRADMEALNMTDATPLHAALYASRYWKGEQAKPFEPLWEMLLVPPVRVIEMVRPPLIPTSQRQL
jgi:hypothetical protein